MALAFRFDDFPKVYSQKERTNWDKNVAVSGWKLIIIIVYGFLSKKNNGLLDDVRVFVFMKERFFGGALARSDDDGSDDGDRDDNNEPMPQSQMGRALLLARPFS